MEIPKTKTIELSDAQRFIEGLKILAKECNVSSVYYNGFGVLKFCFGDGSEIGSSRAFIDAGYINEENFRKKFIDN